MTDQALPAAPEPKPQGWSLAAQFALAGGIVMLAAMFLVGSFVSARIEAAVVRNSANATAQYLESFLSPISQSIAANDTLSPGAHQALDEVFVESELARRILSYKIWKEGGLIIDASNHALLGQRVEVSDDLARAFAGEVTASYAASGHSDHAGDLPFDQPVVEIYSPIREVWSGRVVGVAEVYETATDLRAELAEARRKSWAAVAAVMATIGALLYGIVARGSRTIDRQRAALTTQLAEMRALSAHNRDLRRRVQGAAARASAVNDQLMRQVGADLHDGPAQLMGFAALRLDSLRPAVTDRSAQGELEGIARAITDAIREVRSISRGLSLPDIEKRAPCDILRGVADAHAARTGLPVALDCDLPEGLSLPPAVKNCLYRFAQEGLNNAWRHAEGRGQGVFLGLAGRSLRCVVSDEGPGFEATTTAADATEDDTGLGLAGLRDRVESLGGTLDMRSRPATPHRPAGADLIMTLDLGDA
jgi:signal transduction histidine kinase